MTARANSWEAGHAGRRCAVAFVAGFWALVLRAWHFSLRYDARDATKLDSLIDEGRSIIVVFWHGNYLALSAGLAGRPALVATSRSFRGAVIAGIARRFGFRTIQVDNRPHSTGDVLRGELAERGGMVAVAVDGPLGPRHVVKPGAVAIAVETGAVIVPVQAIALSRVAIARRWDRMELPLPFTRVKLRVGPAIDVTGVDEIAEACDRVARALLALAQPATGAPDLPSGS